MGDFRKVSARISSRPGVLIPRLQEVLAFISNLLVIQAADLEVTTQELNMQAKL
jgi:hypothetical protein